jgi:hypothetical protein
MKEVLYATHSATISFTDDDLLTRTTEHNRPLYVTGMCEGVKINRIFIDPGSSINLMPLKILKSLSLSVKHLSSEKISIQGFNRNSQKALGAVTLPITMGTLKSEAKFYVLDADTSYKALMGRPWLHENYVVPSTLHQCLKYVRDGKQYRVYGDIQPFGIHEIKHSYAKYYYYSRIDLRASTTKAKSWQDRKRRNAVKTKVPHWGSDSETDMEESLPSSDDSSSSEGKSVPMVDLDTPPHSLAIITMPEKHLKDLTLREVHRVEELKTFFVPPATRFVNGKRIEGFSLTNQREICLRLSSHNDKCNRC